MPKFPRIPIIILVLFPLKYVRGVQIVAASVGSSSYHSLKLGALTIALSLFNYRDETGHRAQRSIQIEANIVGDGRVIAIDLIPLLSLLGLFHLDRISPYSVNLLFPVI